MLGLVPGIHEFLQKRKTWMAGTSPAMTNIWYPQKRAVPLWARPFVYA